jgi:hypothetical protein
MIDYFPSLPSAFPHNSSLSSWGIMLLIRTPAPNAAMVAPGWNEIIIIIIIITTIVIIVSSSSRSSQQQQPRAAA